MALVEVLALTAVKLSPAELTPALTPLSESQLVGLPSLIPFKMIAK